MEKIIFVEGMRCEGCVKRISTALENEKLNFKVSLDEKLVYINGCDECAKKALSAISDLGFEPELKN